MHGVHWLSAFPPEEVQVVEVVEVVVVVVVVVVKVVIPGWSDPS